MRAPAVARSPTCRLDSPRAVHATPTHAVFDLAVGGMVGPPRMRQEPPDDSIIHSITPLPLVANQNHMRPTSKAPPPWRNGTSTPAPAPRGQDVTPNDMRAKRSVTADHGWIVRLRSATSPFGILPLLTDETDVWRQSRETTCAYRLRYNAKTPMTVMFEHPRSGGKLWIGSEQPTSLYNTEDGITLRVSCIPGWCKGRARNCL